MNVNAQTYIDFRSAALAAGATQGKRYWRHPDDTEQYSWPQELCEAHGIDPITTPPKARTLAALKRANLAALHAGNDPKGRDGLAMRAMQYALAMRGIETKHRDAFGAMKRCEFDKAPDGSTRVRAVMLDGGRYEIPNWDFVATVVEVEPQGAFA